MKKLFLTGLEHGSVELVDVIGPNKRIKGGIYIRYANGRTDTTTARFLRDLPEELKTQQAAPSGYVLLPIAPNDKYPEDDFVDNVLIHFTSETGTISEAQENHKALCEYLLKTTG